MATTLTSFLERNGFVVDRAPSLAVARDAIENHRFDVVLLDRTLPDGDGLSLIAHAHATRRQQRFIVLTARSDVDDRVEGLDLGSHDYVVKPFEPRELIARMRAALRHPIAEKREARRFGPLVHDVAAGTFAIDDQPLVLRRTEALVLAALMSRPGAIVQREVLEARVYGYDKFVNLNSIESHISRLRKQLGEHTGRIRILAVRGLGYHLVEG